MVISLLTILRRIDDTLYDAAANLGASRFRMFVEITLPLSLPGIMAGSMLVFTLSASAYATPSLVGGSRMTMLGVEVYNLAIQQLAWGDAAAVATVLFILISGAVLFATHVERERQAQGDLPMMPQGIGKVALWAWTILVCLFILGPLLVMIAISITAEEYVSLPYKGVSLRWYHDLFGRPDFLYAARNSIVLAVAGDRRPPSCSARRSRSRSRATASRPRADQSPGESRRCSFRW